MHFYLPADRRKPARPSRDHIWTAFQWCTSKSPQAYAPLPCCKWGELWISVETVLKSASVQVQAIQVVNLLLINSVGGHLELLCSSTDLENGPCLSHSRRYFLDILPAVASHRALRFLRHKMEKQELTNWEVAQSVLVALHSSTPTQDVMEEATVGFFKHSNHSLLILASAVFITLTRLQRLWKYKGLYPLAKLKGVYFLSVLRGGECKSKGQKWIQNKTGKKEWNTPQWQRLLLQTVVSSLPLSKCTL